MYGRKLTQDEWGALYDVNEVDTIVKRIKKGEVQIWARELCNIIPSGSSFIEVGCGTGISSLYLSKGNRKGYAIDYAESAVQIVKACTEMLGVDLSVMKYDATSNLPISGVDYIFQSGLLEHFTTEEQVDLLKKWKKSGKMMVSMIPNASSVPYRVGKAIMEENGTWAYGRETPKSSMIPEFLDAGIKVVNEYSIGSQWALNFLPEKHYLRKAYNRLLADGVDLDSMMQGYILVTIGECY